MRRSIEEFIKKCLVCQQTKYSTQASGGLLQPLLIPTAVWEDVSMDFIMGMPVFKGLTIILVVVDRFTKYAHFGTLPTSFNASKVAELFMDMVVKHHGFPKTIVSDRDPIFVSTFWKQLFKASGTQLNLSMVYHPQTDGQTEVVNRGLEQYLRAMVLDRPQQWVRLLSWAEFSYNTSYHSSIKMTPFQALYGFVPPSIIPYPPGSSKVATIDELLVKRNVLLRQLKENLFAARNRMEMQANREGIVGVTNLPEEDREGQPVDQPLAEATWEDLSKFLSTYPSYQLEDKLNFEGEENVTPVLQHVGRPIRTKSKPKDYCAAYIEEEEASYGEDDQYGIFI
ncbi:ty3-gypsy retrotransposon protein [Tanacetum coccineum]